MVNFFAEKLQNVMKSKVREPASFYLILINQTPAIKLLRALAKTKHV